MNLAEIKAKRLASLENAYNQLVKVLDKELDTEEVDPEKMKISLSAYKQAAEDSDFILRQIIAIKEEEGEIVQKKKKVKKENNLSPESRIKR